MRKLDKPHISLCKSSRPKYVCVARYVAGYGDSPGSAWADWVLQDDAHRIVREIQQMAPLQWHRKVAA